MSKLYVHDWEIWQTYRKDRGTPPWIKIHRCLLSDVKWASLGDHDKGALVSIWILAADRKGEIPADAKVIQKLCMLDKEPNLNKFIKLGLLDGKLASSGCQGDAPETETETETEKIYLSEFLAGIVRTQKNINITPVKIKTWAKAIGLLINKDGVSRERIKTALEWYKENVGGEYIPVIESGKSLREKFSKLEDAIKRDNKKTEQQIDNTKYCTPEEAEHLKKLNLWKPHYAIKETTG